MCPMIEHSCCFVSDQVTIFEQYEVNKEREKIDRRFLYHETIYNNFIDEA